MTDYADSRNWSGRIRQDEEFRRDHLYAMDQMIAAGHGPHYSRRATATYMPWNHYHSYTSLMVGDLMFDIPKVRVETRRPGSQKEAAEAIEHGLNRWVRDAKLREVGQKLALDFCYMWGVAMVRQVPNRWEKKTEEQYLFDEDGNLTITSEESLWPAVYRIPQPLFFCDSRALTIEEADYMGHGWYADSEGLVKEAEGNPNSGWKKSEIRQIASGGKAEKGKASEVDPLRGIATKEHVKHELEMLTVWVAGMQPDEKKGPDQGYHGALLTFARMPSQGKGQKSGVDWAEVKDPEPYYGPKSGPYVMFGAYSVPNRLWPMSPLVAVEAQIRAVNRQARAVERSNERHKRVILYNERDTKTAGKLRRAQHDFWVGIPGFDKNKFAEAEIGGATEGQYKGTMWAFEQLQRVSAMDDAQQGKVTGQGTATEHSIAADTTQSRKAYLRQQFGDAMSRVLEVVAWFLYYDTKVIFPLGADAAQAMDMEEPWFHGGLHTSDGDASFDDLELEIEAFSMQRRGGAEHARATEAGLGFIVNTLPLRAQFPYANWDKIDDMASQMYGIPDLDDLVDNEAAVEMGIFMQAANEQQPRLDVDVGAGYANQGPQQSPMAPPKVSGPQGVSEGAKAFAGGNAGVSTIGGAT